MRDKKLTILTYNIFLNSAAPQIESLLRKYRPDLVALQEVDTRFENLMHLEIGGYRLANYANCFFKRKQIHGVATYYNSHTVQLTDSGSFALPRNTYEKLLIFLQGGNRPRTVLRTDFVHKSTGISINFYNLHLSPYGMNGHRMKQISKTFTYFAQGTDPTIVAGDFNFPYLRSKFERVMQSFDLKEATNSIYSTFQKRLFGLINLNFKLDYILYRNITPIETKRLPETGSDHFPILSTFKLN